MSPFVFQTTRNLLVRCRCCADDVTVVVKNQRQTEDRTSSNRKNGFIAEACQVRALSGYKRIRTLCERRCSDDRRHCNSCHKVLKLCHFSLQTGLEIARTSGPNDNLSLLIIQ